MHTIETRPNIKSVATPGRSSSRGSHDARLPEARTAHPEIQSVSPVPKWNGIMCIVASDDEPLCRVTMDSSISLRPIL